MCHRVGVDWCIRQYLGQLSVYILVTIHRSSVKQSVDWVSIALVVCQQWTYQWAISRVPIRYRRCNIWLTIFITCTNFFSNLILKVLIPDWSVTCTKSQAIFTYRPTSWSSVGRHIIIAIGQVVVESQLRVSQCPMAVDRGIGCNAD